MTVTALYLSILFCVFCVPLATAQGDPTSHHYDKIIISRPQWDTIPAIICNTTATLQIVASPILNPEISPIATTLFHNLATLQADIVRYVPWFPYPHYAVAELDPPNDNTKTTSWNFPRELQQTFLHVVRAVHPKRIVINFSTQPTWMFQTTNWEYPKDPNKIDWKYPKGTPTNQTSQLLAKYYGRLAQWIFQGSFLDEYGNPITGGPQLANSHTSTYWEVFNEPDSEHAFTPQQYNEAYDAIVREIQSKVNSNIVFVGMAIEQHDNWDFWQTFLTPHNHHPKVRDALVKGMASFHWYAKLSSRTNITTYLEPFQQVKPFLQDVDKIIALRNQLNPSLQLALNEAGVIPPDDNNPHNTPLPPVYFNMVAAFFTILTAELSRKGIEVVGSSQFVGTAPTPPFDAMWPGVSMMNVTTGQGNPRYWALKLFLRYFGPGDRILPQEPRNPPSVYVQSRITTRQEKVVIVVNPSLQTQVVELSELVGAKVHMVDEETHDQPWKEYTSESDQLVLQRFAVVVVEAKSGYVESGSEDVVAKL